MRFVLSRYNTQQPLLTWEYPRVTSVARVGALLTGVAPHGLTQRAIYTVPGGNYATIGSIQASLRVRTAPTVRGTPQIYVDVQFGLQQRIYTAWIVGVTPDDEHTVVPILGLDMPGTTSFRIYTQDDSTDGTMDYAYGFIASAYTATAPATPFIV